MNTDELIERLAKELQPVRPLPRPGIRATVWLLGAAAYVGALAVAMTAGRLPAGIGDVRMWLPLVAAFLATLLAARGAFASVVPGHAANAVGTLVLAALVWLGALVATSEWQLPAAAIASARHEWVCVAVIVGGGVPLMVLLAAMLRRGAPLKPGRTAALAAMTVGTLANVGACWSLPHASNEITLVWHGGTVLALVLVAAVAGRLVFTWRTAVRRNVPPPS